MILQSCGESSSTTICSCKQVLLGMCRQSYYSGRINRLSHLTKAGLFLGGSILMATIVLCHLRKPIPTYQTQVLSKMSRCLLCYCWFPWLSCLSTIRLHNFSVYSSHSEVLKRISLAHTIARNDESHGCGWWLLTSIVASGEIFWWLNSLCKCCTILQKLSNISMSVSRSV